MKVYDKEIYNKQESIKTIIIIVFAFLLGFFAGYMAKSYVNDNQVPENTNSTYIENQ